MSQENGSDPWDEVEGIPPLVKRTYQVPPGEERSWLTTLHEIRGLVNWLAFHVMDVRVSIEHAFDAYLAQNIPDSAEMASEMEGAFKVHDHIRKSVNRGIEDSDAVHQLLLRLFQKLHREVMDAVQASESGLDE